MRIFGHSFISIPCVGVVKISNSQNKSNLNVSEISENIWIREECFLCVSYLLSMLYLYRTLIVVYCVLLFSLILQRWEKKRLWNLIKKRIFVQYRPQECTYWLCWLFCFIKCVLCLVCVAFVVCRLFSCSSQLSFVVNVEWASIVCTLHTMPHDVHSPHLFIIIHTALSRK